VVGTVVAVTAAMYASVLAATRVAGRRTLAQLSAFDVVVTIALGTILGSTAVSPSVSYGDGVAAILALLSLQVVIGSIRRRSPAMRRLVDFRPLDVVDGGQVDLPRGLLGPQLTEDELRSQLRLRGCFDPGTVRQAVLEPVGGMSVASAGPVRRRLLSTREVLEAHLECRMRGDLGADLRENYSPDVVLLSAEGVHRGHDGVRRLAAVLRSYVQPGSYDYGRLLVADEVGFLRWSAQSAGIDVHDGADIYVVRGGLIIAQTIHYSPRER
jgi:uncharacterized membrane protein YcaP (DUF421 family)